MDVVKMVTPLLSLFSIGQRPAPIETRPALPEWRPAGGDIVPVPGQKVERVIRRVKQDRNVTIYEEEVIFIQEPVAAPEPQPEEPYGFIVVQQAHPPTAEQWAILRDWQAGRAKFLGGSRHPADVIRRESGQVQLNGGRIVLNG